MVRDVGELRRRILIQRPISGIVPETGYPATVWEDVARVWAKPEDVSGREFYNAAAVQMENTTVFYIRWRKGLDTSMRILHAGEVYEITQDNRMDHIGDFMAIRAKIQRQEVPTNE